MPPFNEKETFGIKNEDLVNPVIRDFSTKTFFHLLERSTDVISILDESGIIIYISPSVRSVFGYNPESLIGKNAFSLLYPEDVSSAKSNFSELLNSPGTTHKFEHRLVLDDGSVKWTEGQYTNLLNDTDIKGIVGNFRDISERKKSEEALWVSREKFRLLAEHSEDVIARYDQHLRFIYVNKALEVQTRIPQEKFIGKNNKELGIPSHIVNRWENELKKVFDTGKTNRFSFNRETPLGMKFFDSIIIPEFDAEDHVVSVLCTTRDLTEIKEKQAALELSNEELNTFLYKASHDLRGPIATIQGLVIIAKENKENIETYLEFISRTAGRMDKTLDNLKMIGKIKQKEIHTSGIDFSKVIQKVLKSLEAVDGFKNVKFAIDIEMSRSFVSDFQLISTILYNLMHNAICYRNEYIEKGIVKIEIRDKNENQILLDIEDTGIGIQEEMKDEIFKMFYRGSSKSTGAGLGLYVVKNAVDLLNGEIQLIRTHSGTRFHLILPNMK